MPEATPDKVPNQTHAEDKFALLFMYAEEPVHAGTGQGLGAVDKPIQREVHTGFPVIYGSSVKGALRARVSRDSREDAAALFGSAPPDAQDLEDAAAESEGSSESRTRPGCLSPHDAQIVLFPIQSLFDGFAWITCPLALAVLRRNLELLEGHFKSLKDKEKWDLFGPVPLGSCRLAEGAAVVHKVADQDTVVLREYDFAAETDANVTKLASWLREYALDERLGAFWRDSLCGRLVVLSDEDFRFFVTTATEVYTRVCLDENKTVRRGLLWVEEALPAESLLCAPVASKTVDQTTAADALTKAQKLTSLVIGGTETIGRGRVGLKWLTCPEKGVGNA